MSDRVVYRLGDIVDAIDKIDTLLQGRTFSDLQRDPFAEAAFERFLEILSEASRHIPDSLKASAPEIEWRRLADIGNHLRHAYNRVDAEILWNLHADGRLAELRDVAETFRTNLDR
jgi:uncharacterized protein with HEPN domain